MNKSYKDFVDTDEGTKLLNALPPELLESFGETDLGTQHGDTNDAKMKLLQNLQSE